MNTTISDEYRQALACFENLPHVHKVDLDAGDLSQLIFRAQHELDLLCEGEWNDDTVFTRAQETKIRNFISGFGLKSDVERMNKETPRALADAARARLKR